MPGRGRHRVAGIAQLALGLIGLMLLVPASGSARARFDVRVFAHVPTPGAPEGLAIARDGKVYVGTLNAEEGDKRAPSRVFAYSPSGKLERSYEIKGQNLAEEHGITGFAFDAEGRLYIGDLSPPRVLRLDLRTGRQETYATFRDVKPCGSAPPGNCSAGIRDFPSWPDYLAFTPDGTLYETDSLQSLIWRVPKGGGKGRIFLTDPRLQSLIGSPGFGPSAMSLMPDRRTLMFTTIEGPTGDGDPTAGRLWKLPIRPDGRPGELKEFWTSESADGPGGIGFGRRSGDIYMALSGSNQMVLLSPEGKELERAPSPAANEMQEVPFDSPLAVVFSGDRLLVTNSGFLSGSASSWAVLDVFAGEPGVAPLVPRIGAASRLPRLHLRVSPRRVRAGRTVRFRFRVTGRGGRRVRGARIAFAGRHARTGRRGRAAIRRRLRRRGVYRARACKRGYRCARARVRVLRRR